MAFGGLLLYLGLSFLFKLNPARPAAALPEVLAAAVAMLVALVLHRRRRVRAAVRASARRVGISYLNLLFHLIC